MAITDNMPGMSVNRKENHMLELRKKLSNYQEVFYLLFLLPMTGMHSMGINSEDRIYLYVFAVATLFLLLKMAVTDFTWREVAIMAVLTLLFGMNFLRNGEKTLILTVMAIFGAKNVNLDKAMKYALWEKAVLTVGTLTLAATGVIENEVLTLLKNDTYVNIPCYGYYHPNMAFANVFVVLLLSIIVYRDKMKWYVYVGETLIIMGAYKLFMCRTGVLVWGALCMAVAFYRIIRHFHIERWMMKMFAAIPIVLAWLTLYIPHVIKKDPNFGKRIDVIMTGRMRLIGLVYDEVWTPEFVLGHNPSQSFDTMYFHLVYNYGWILFVVSIVAYVMVLWYCSEHDEYYITVVLGIAAIYGYMEMLPLSVLWNLPLLYMAKILFQGKKLRNEQLQ